MQIQYYDIMHNRRKLHSCASYGPVAQWITRLPTEQKIPGSSPGGFDFFMPQMQQYNSPLHN